MLIWETGMAVAKERSLTNSEQSPLSLAVPDPMCGRKSGMFRAALGFALVFGVLVSPALATPPFQTPEIDPGSLGSAVTLLIGGMMILTGRRRSR